jgi:hypothetical protein
MYTLLCTKKLRDRIPQPLSDVVIQPSTALGNWYATALFSKPQLALFVNERTLLPVVMPLAPAAGVAARFPAQLAAVLAAHGVDAGFIEREIGAMKEPQLAKTASRSILGTMNDFIHLLECRREDERSDDWVGLSVWLAQTPCGAVKYQSPDRLLGELVRAPLS